MTKIFRQGVGPQTSEPKAQAPSVVNGEAYAALIDSICKLCGTPPSPSNHDRCEVTIADTMYTLIPSLTLEGIDGLAYFAEVGPLPQDKKEAIALRLLESNLFMVSRDLPAFCVNPQTSNVVLAGCLAFNGLTADAAHEFLSKISLFAGQWRDAQFEPMPPEVMDFMASAGAEK